MDTTQAISAPENTLKVEALADGRTGREIVSAVEEYVEIGGFLDAGLRQQTEFDLESLTRATGRTLSASEREKFIQVQQRANRWTYLGSGMTHRNFLAMLGRLRPAARERVERLAPTFC